MNDFLKLIEESQVLAQIRSMVPPEKLEEYDEFVKQKLVEENGSFLMYTEKISNIKQEITNAREPKGQPGYPDISNDK